LFHLIFILMDFGGHCDCQFLEFRQMLCADNETEPVLGKFMNPMMGQQLIFYVWCQYTRARREFTSYWILGVMVTGN
jgi:hypothetical protein